MKMKTALVVLLTSVVLIGSSANAAEKTTYASGGKTMNLRFSPLGLLIGAINVDFDFMVNENWTVGPTVSYWSFETSGLSTSSTSNIKLTAYSFGGRANYHMDGVFQDGMYISPLVQFVGATASTQGGQVSSNVSSFALTGLIGYHWFWDTFNLNLGGGVYTLVGNTKATLSSGSSSTDVNLKSGGGAGIALDFMMGFTF